MTHAVDANVGQRIRHGRWLIGMTQLELADRIGLKLQQVHKYETGAHRVSASRLWDISNALEVPIDFFFDELDAQGVPSRLAAIRRPLEEEVSELVRYYHAIPKDQRSRLFELARTLRNRSNSHNLYR